MNQKIFNNVIINKIPKNESTGKSEFRKIAKSGISIFEYIPEMTLFYPAITPQQKRNESWPINSATNTALPPFAYKTGITDGTANTSSPSAPTICTTFLAKSKMEK
jgi:hypothetical protein